MDPHAGDGSSGAASVAWGRALLAHGRAGRAEAAAERHELMAVRTGQEFHARIAAAQRRTAVRHRSSAALQESFALRMAEWEQGRGAPPRFMAVVAEACGARSAALSLADGDQIQVAVAASDERSRAAQDLEYVLGFGPTRDAMRDGRPVLASGAELELRWPGYGSELAALGVAEVAAVPLAVSGNCFGGLAVFDPAPGSIGASAFTEVAGALISGVLLGPDGDPELYGGLEHRDALHLAAGMVSVQADCGVTDALALIRARAFAVGEPLTAVANRIVSGELRLDGDRPG